MRKVLVLLFIMALVAGLLAIAGCGSDETTIKTPEGEVKVTEDNGEVTIEDGGDTTTYETSEKAPSEKDLGVPIYPDAEYVAGSGGSVSVGGEFSGAAGDFTTGDSFDDVVSFYTDELGPPLYMETTTGEATWLMENDDGTTSTVSVMDEDGEVLITLARAAL